MKIGTNNVEQGQLKKYHKTKTVEWGSTWKPIIKKIQNFKMLHFNFVDKHIPFHLNELLVLSFCKNKSTQQVTKTALNNPQRVNYYKVLVLWTNGLVFLMCKVTNENQSCLNEVTWVSINVCPGCKHPIISTFNVAGGRHQSSDNTIRSQDFEQLLLIQSVSGSKPLECKIFWNWKLDAKTNDR